MKLLKIFYIIFGISPWIPLVLMVLGLNHVIELRNSEFFILFFISFTMSITGLVIKHFYYKKKSKQ